MPHICSICQTTDHKIDRVNIMPSPDQVLEEARSESIQARAKGSEILSSAGNVFLVPYMAQAGALMAPWWSSSRDDQLRKFWRKSDHLSGAVYTMESKMTAIPFRIEPKDRSISEHVRRAEELTDLLYWGAEFGEGWVNFYAKFVEDLVTQDNGTFFEIIGPGSPSGPLMGAPTSIAHLDSFRCTRTGDPEFPVVFEDIDGSRYKLHYTRVGYTSLMSSPKVEMNGVGFCSVSRCLNVSQTLVDILTFKQEKMGSRPHRAIMITKGGLSPSDIQEAFALAESQMDDQGLSRYSKVVVAGVSSLENAGLDVIDLAELPDGFDEETSITMGMATIALAFGMDARELFPAMTSGATRADALLQHMKQRGKGPGQILQLTEQLFNFKFLPSYLRLNFDFQDDAQDRQVAEIKMIRSNRRWKDITAGTIDIRIAREIMRQDGDLDRSQFERLELQDGRLPSGASVLALFYSRDPIISRLLSFPVPDPLAIGQNDKKAMIQMIRERMSDVNKLLVNSHSEAARWATMQAIAALQLLEKKYQDGNESPFSTFAEDNAEAKKVQAAARFDTRIRRTNKTEPQVPAGESDQVNQKELEYLEFPALTH